MNKDIKEDLLGAGALVLMLTVYISIYVIMSVMCHG